MSQAPILPPAARPQAGAGDSPDLLFVVRHHRWLIVIGTLLGLAVGVGLWQVLRMYAPKYSATAIFYVQPMTNVVERGQPGSGDADETGKFIRRQVYIIKGDQFLDKLLEVKSVQATAWYSRAKPSPRAVLKSDALAVAGMGSNDLFRITLTIAEREDVKTIVEAISSEYDTFLKNMLATMASEEEERLVKAREQMSIEAKRARVDAEEFRTKHDIQAMMNSQTIAMAALAGLDQELTKLSVEFTLTEKSVKTLMEEAKKPDYKLPLGVYQQLVEADPQVRALDNDRLGLERELEIATKNYGPSHPTTRGIQQRLDTVNKQLAQVRGDRVEVAKQSYLSNNVAALETVRARIEDTKLRHDARKKEVQQLDNFLVRFKVLEDEAKKQEMLLADLDQKLTIERLKRTAQPQRIKQIQQPYTPSPEDIAFPTLTMFAPIGLITGLALSFALAYLLELTNTRVRTPRDITRTLQLPLLGFVPDQVDDDMLRGDLSTSVRTSPSSMIAESFRQIRGRISAHADGTALRSILVASIAPGGGATTVASNLANGLALNGRRVLLIDANFYRPGLKAIYPGVSTTGFSDVLSDPTKASQAVSQAADMPNLFVMGPGTKASSASSQLLDSAAARDVIARFRESYDVVIFDGAPLSLVSDSLSLAARVEGVVAVVRAGRITRGTVARVRDQLRQVKANLLGIVLNAAQTQSSGYFKENYRTFYRYAQNGHANAAGRPTAVGAEN